MSKRLLICIILLSIFACGCSEQDSEPVTITIIHAWGGTEADHIAMRNIYQDFQLQNPDINVQFIAMPTRDEMLSKIEDMIMVGNIPDIVDFGGMGENNVYHFMQENDMLVDVMPYIEEDASFAGSISEANLQYWTVGEEHLYNVSAVLSLSGGYWYNLDILRSAGIDALPATWTEFFDMCEKIQSWASDNSSDVRALQPSAEGYLYFLDHILADDMEDYRFSLDKHLADTTVGISNEALSIALDRIERSFAYTTIEGAEYSYRDETSLFNQGQIALYINGVWGAAMISDEIDAGYALLPTDSGTSTSCLSACLGYVVGNNQDSMRQEAAVRFVKYMMSQTVQRRIFEETGQIPADYEELTHEDSRIYNAMETVLDAAKKIEVIDNFWSASQKSVITEGLVELLSGNISKVKMKGLIKQ